MFFLLILFDKIEIIWKMLIFLLKGNF